MYKINVVGVSGSGKTTLAKKLADKFNLAHIELDKLHWKDDWTAHEEVDFQHQISKFLDQYSNGWVVDGYYGNKQGERPWQEADTIIYLDIPLWLVKLRIAKRSLKRKLKRQLVWGTNNEKFKHQLRLQKSVNKWHPVTQNQMLNFAKDVPENVNYYHFKSNKQANDWLKTL